MAIAICRTEGCANAGHAIELTLEWTDEDGNTQQADAVQCGVCGQDITDITDQAQP